MATIENDRVRRFLLIFFMFLISGCTTLGLIHTYQNYPKVNSQVNALIEQGSFTEAREYLGSFSDMKDEWCFEFYDNGRCRIVLKMSPVSELLTTIARAEECSQALKAAEGADLTKDDADRLIKKIEANCKESNKWDRAGPKSANAVLDALMRRKESLPFSIRGDTKIASDLAEKQNSCQRGLKWVFYVSGERPKWAEAGQRRLVAGRRVVGEFSDRNSCEAARLNTPAAQRSMWDDGCVLRYLGKTLKAEVVKADYMFEGGLGRKQRNSIFFSSLTFCEQTISKAFQIESPTHDKLEIQPYESSGEVRIIKPCYSETISICEEGQEDAGIEGVQFLR